MRGVKHLTLFVLLESRSAFNLYFEPLRQLGRLAFWLRQRRSSSRSSKQTPPYLARAVAEGFLARALRRPPTASAPNRQTVAILGPIGAGKTNLVMQLLGVDSASLIKMRTVAGLHDQSWKHLVRYSWREDIDLVDSPGIDASLALVENALGHLQEWTYVVFVIDAVLLFEGDPVLEVLRALAARRPVVVVLKKIDILPSRAAGAKAALVERRTGLKPIPLSASAGTNIDWLRDLLVSWEKE